MRFASCYLSFATITEITVQLRNVHGTEAALGWAGSHTLIVDRAEGKAGGKGLGFNGGQLLGLAIGGCLCNDLRYVAHDLGVQLLSVEVDVTIRLEGNPTLATAAVVAVRVDAADKKTDVEALIERAVAISTVANSLQRGLSIAVTH
jgi:organic hydroperoxide reductase OsmC/OhrA